MDPKEFDRLNQLAEDAPDEPELWVPKEIGERTAGLFVGYTRGRQSRIGNTYDMISLHDPRNGSTIHVPLWRSALKARVADLKPRPNEFLSIEYLGLTPTRNGEREYHAYRVILIDANGQQVHWRDADSDVDGGLLAPASPRLTEWDVAHNQAPPADRQVRLRDELELDDDDTPF